MLFSVLASSWGILQLVCISNEFQFGNNLETGYSERFCAKRAVGNRPMSCCEQENLQTFSLPWEKMLSTNSKIWTLYSEGKQKCVILELYMWKYHHQRNCHTIHGWTEDKFLKLWAKKWTITCYLMVQLARSLCNQFSTHLSWPNPWKHRLQTNIFALFIYYQSWITPFHVHIQMYHYSISYQGLFTKSAPIRSRMVYGMLHYNSAWIIPGPIYMSLSASFMTLWCMSQLSFYFTANHTYQKNLRKLPTVTFPWEHTQTSWTNSTLRRRLSPHLSHHAVPL